MRVASRELRNDTAGVLRRVARGESLHITVNGEAVAELGPLRNHRSHWTPRSEFLATLPGMQADAALTAVLQELSGDTSELGPIG